MTAADRARERLLWAWLEANPNQPMREGMDEVRGMVDAILSEGYGNGYDAGLADGEALMLSHLRSHMFAKCPACGAAVDEPEAYDDNCVGDASAEAVNQAETVNQAERRLRDCGEVYGHVGCVEAANAIRDMRETRQRLEAGTEAFRQGRR